MNRMKSITAAFAVLSLLLLLSGCAVTTPSQRAYETYVQSYGEPDIVEEYAGDEGRVYRNDDPPEDWWRTDHYRLIYLDRQTAVDIDERGSITESPWSEEDLRL